MVKGGASPDDPALTDYWAERRRKIKPPVDGYTLRLLTKQDGRCQLCGDELLSADQPPESPSEWERWWLLVTRKAMGPYPRIVDTGWSISAASCSVAACCCS